MSTLQIRKEAIDIMNKLRGRVEGRCRLAAFQNGDSVSMYPFLALSGPRGSGKSWVLSPLLTRSMLLRTLYYYCRRNNWITLFVPSARIWTHQGYISTIPPPQATRSSR